MQKPQRPYKSFKDFVRRRFWCKPERWIVANPDKYPCLECFGRGCVYDENDPPCPIEGNKLRRMLTCPACQGTGCGTQKEARQAYRAAIQEWKERAAHYDRLAQARQAALQKLTPEEIEAIQELGV